MAIGMKFGLWISKKRLEVRCILCVSRHGLSLSFPGVSFVQQPALLVGDTTFSCTCRYLKTATHFWAARVRPPSDQEDIGRTGL